MINQIKLLRNIGTFESDNPDTSLMLKGTTLIYADNGRGKTTLAAILRSLASGDPLPILERKRLGSTNPPQVVLERHEPPSTLMFKNGAWTNSLPELKIFDDTFIDENVYSGLSVGSQHRQNLNELILGDQGVTLNSQLQELVSRIGQHNKDLDEKEKAIPKGALFGFSVDEFCALNALPDIDRKIEKAKVELMASRNQEKIQSRPLFETLELPGFDVEAINRILQTDLPDLDQSAEARVQAHVQALGDGGESWVEKGFMYDLVEDEENCPFCGQGLDNLPLLNHYRAYFSESYVQLKRSVAEIIDDINSSHADNAPASFERAVGNTKTTSLFWETYVDVPNIDIDTSAIVNDWKNARETVTTLLEAKQSAPLERIILHDDALTILDSYNSHRKSIREISQRLASSNEEIRNLQRQIEETDKEQIADTLRELNATKARHSVEIDPLCQNYINEINAKNQTETERDKTREELNNYRNTVFPTIESSVNNYLQELNADFRIGSLKPTSIAGGKGSSCNYNVVINDTPVAIGKKKTSKESHDPSFRNSLSAGDRNTLALALFFSSLDDNPNLSKSIVVIDDPMASLDDHRSLATVQKVRALTNKAKQVIVLSHNKRFLCEVWSYLRSQDCCPLKIAQNESVSTVRSWNVSQDAITEYDKRHELLKAFAKNQIGCERTIVKEIRPHLEGYLRVACPEDFQPGEVLERFLKKCRNRLGKQEEILNKETIEELTDIKEYSNPFHHGPNPIRQTEHINTTELLNFVKRTLDFVNPFRS